MCVTVIVRWYVQRYAIRRTHARRKPCCERSPFKAFVSLLWSRVQFTFLLLDTWKLRYEDDLLKRYKRLSERKTRLLMYIADTHTHFSHARSHSYTFECGQSKGLPYLLSDVSTAHLMEQIVDTFTNACTNLTMFKHWRMPQLKTASDNYA